MKKTDFRPVIVPILFYILAGTDARAQASRPALASARISTEHMQQYSDLAVEWMQQYLRIDTTNPPGNEMRGARFFKKILDAEGIENQVFEYAPGRADLWAVLPHSTAATKRPIILLNHMDVVTSDATHWSVPPFSGALVNGSMYGRGAQDMKEEGLAQLVVMVMLRREKIALDRDLIFLAVSDEEAAGTGTDWFIANQRDHLRNAEFLINEGGEKLLQDGRVRYVGIDVGEIVVPLGGLQNVPRVNPRPAHYIRSRGNHQPLLVALGRGLAIGGPVSLVAQHIVPGMPLDLRLCCRHGRR